MPSLTWAESSCPANLIPMFGGIKKTEPMLKADDKLRSTLTEQGRTPEGGAINSVRLGWRYFSRDHDPATAMKRFNQAWLLDPNNGEAYYGMAVMSEVLRSDPQFAPCPFTPERSEGLFKKAISMHGTPPVTHVDYGRFLWSQERYDDSLSVLLNIVEKRPEVKNARANIAFVFFKQNDFERACAWSLVAKGKGDTLEPGFLNDVCSRAFPDK